MLIIPSIFRTDSYYEMHAHRACMPGAGGYDAIRRISQKGG